METVLKQKKQMIYLPLIVLMFTQIGTSGDNAVLSVATNALISALHASMNDIQLANMVYSLCAGAFMVAGGMLGIIIGWKKNFRIGVILAIIGELMLAISTNVVMFTWGGRLLVGLGASFMIPSVLGLIPGIYSGKERVFAFGAIGAATGIAAGAGIHHRRCASRDVASRRSHRSRLSAGCIWFSGCLWCTRRLLFPDSHRFNGNPRG